METESVYCTVRTGPLNTILFSNNWNSGLYQTAVWGVAVPSVINRRKKGRILVLQCLQNAEDDLWRRSLLCYPHNPNSTVRVAASQRQRFDPPRMSTGRQVTSRLPHTLKATSWGGEFSVRYLTSGNAWVIYHYLSPNELLVRGLKFNNKEMCQLSVNVLPALCRKAIDLWRDASKFNSELQTALQWHMSAIVWHPCCLIMLTGVTGLSMAWRLEICLGYQVLCDGLSK